MIVSGAFANILSASPLIDLAKIDSADIARIIALVISGDYAGAVDFLLDDEGPFSKKARIDIGGSSVSVSDDTYSYLPAVKILKPATAKKAVTVRWKKVGKKNLKKFGGYEIQVATDPHFTNIVKTANVSKKKTSKTIKGLTSKHTYYVQIRAYKNAADGRHVSQWRAKRVKTK